MAAMMLMTLQFSNDKLLLKSIIIKIIAEMAATFDFTTFFTHTFEGRTSLDIIVSGN